MLDSLRQATRTWVAKLLLGLLVLSFAVWGISGQMFEGTTTDVVRAGETGVSVLDYRLAYDRQVAMLSQQLGTRVTRAQAEAFGLDNQVLAELTAGALIDETARRMRLGLSQDRLAEMAAADPAFRGADGRFDRRQFEFVLNRAGMRPEDYLRSRQQAAVRQQIVDAVASGVSAPDTLLRSIALYRGEDRTVEYVPLPRSLVEPIEPPDDETLQAWFDERRDAYAAPEYRKISYVTLQPEDIVDPELVSEDEVQAYYERHRDSFTTPERRAIEQLNFAGRDEAVAARESIRTGTTFADLVSVQGRTMEDVRLGTYARGEVADEAVAEAAFALGEGQISDVVDGAFGPVLLRVTEIIPEQTTPLEEVEEEIRRELAMEDAGRLIFDTYDAYEDARAAGMSMQEAAEGQGLVMLTVEAVDRTGRRPDGTEVRDLPMQEELINEAFEAEEGFENPPLNFGRSGYLFYEVDEVMPARERSLDEVRDEVVQDWIDAEATARLTARAREMEEALQGGAPLSEIAAEIDQEVVVKRGLKREADDPDLGRAGVAAVFSVPRNGTGIFPNPAGDGQFLFAVTEVFEPASVSAEAVPSDVVSRITRGITDDLLDQLVARLQTEYEVTVNPTAMQQALSF